MAPAKKRRTKRFSAKATMKRRLGLLGWGNSRPFFEWSKTITTRTLGEGHNPGTLAGAFFHLPVNNWNDPLGTLSNLVAGSGSLTANRHPLNHDDAITRNYNRARVLSWSAKINVNWIASASGTQDFIVAYTFSEDTNTEVTLVAGTAARIERLEIETNPRWTVKKFEAANNGQFAPSSTRGIFIRVPNVFAYCDIIARGEQDVEANNGTVGHILADSSSATNAPTITLFCTVVIMTESGIAMAIDSVHATVAITQRVKLMRDHQGAEDMDEGEVDVHA